MNKADRVAKAAMECLFSPSEIVDGKPNKEPVYVEGITAQFGFHPERLEQHREEVKDLLKDFDDKFYDDGGGGWSFLNFCQTKDGTLWGQHRIMETLIALGIGLGLVEFLGPRECWKAMPGGVPYIIIKRKEQKNL